MLLTGKAIVAFALGSIFSIELNRYVLFILIGAVLALYYYTKTSIMRWHSNVRMGYKTHYIGYFGFLLLALFFGIQSPQMFLKKYLLALGVILVFVPVKDIVKGLK